MPNKGKVTYADAQRRKAEKAEAKARKNGEPAADVQDAPAGPEDAAPGKKSASWRQDASRLASKWSPVISAAGVESAAEIIAGWPWWVEASCIGVTDIVIVFAAIVAAVKGQRSEAMGARYIGFAVAAAAWLTIAVPTGFFGFTGGMLYDLPQVALATAPLLVATQRMTRKKPVPPPPPPAPEPAAEIPAEPAYVPPPPPQKDPKQQEFERRFCTGTFGDMTVDSFQHLGENGERGFRLTFSIPQEGSGTVTDFDSPANRKALARMYNVIQSRVAIGHDLEGDRAHNPDELHGYVQISRVRPPAQAHALRPNPLVSTYDPRRGWVEIGSLGSTPGYWALTKPPRSGMIGGIVAGPPGQGKTGVLLNIISQTGLAMDSQGRRLFNIAVGDPQKMPLGFYRGQVGIYGAGRLGSLHLLRVAAEITQSRADWISSTPFTDADGNRRESRGWSMPDWDEHPNWPGWLFVFDEASKIFGKQAGAEERKEAGHLAAMLAREIRKTSMGLVLASQTPDLDQLVERDLREILKNQNVLAFKSDESSGDMIDIVGDPLELPDEPGYAYGAGPGLRRGEILSVNWLEEEAAGETDAYDVARFFNQFDVPMHPADERALRACGWDGERNWVITEEFAAQWLADQEALEVAELAGGVDLSAPAAAADQPARIQPVLDALMDKPGTEEELAGRTGLNGGEVVTAIAVLSHQGQITQNSENRWQVAA
jgi:hypothetical protein